MSHSIFYYFPQFSPLLLTLLVSVVYERGILYNNQLSIREKGVPWISPIMPWLLVFGWVTFMASMRIRINDTGTYIASFKATSGTWDSIRKIITGSRKEKGWEVLMTLFKMFISSDFHVFFGFVAGIESILFVHTLRRECVSFLDACYFFCCSTLYYNYFSLMRQWLAISIVFAAGTLIRDRKFFKYAIVCAVAAQFHNSAYLLIPVYFMVTGKPWGIKQLLIVSAFAVFLILLSPMLEVLSSSLEGTTYDYIVTEMQSNTGSSIIRAVIAAVPLVMSFLKREKITSSMMNVCVNFSLLNFMLNLLASFTSGLYVIRLATYAGVFNILLFPYLLECTLGEDERKLIKYFYFLIYLIYFIIQMNHQGSWSYHSDIIRWLSN